MQRSIQFDRGDIGTRIDRVLRRHLHDVPGISRNKIQRLIEGGAVRLNGKPAPRIAWRLAAGDVLSVELPDRPMRQRPAAEAIPIEIVYEDDDLLIVNKPAGQVAHPAFRNTSRTLLNGLLAYAGGRWTPSLVNRIDKDTSGLVLVAKNKAMHAALQVQMSSNGVEKDYFAVVRGKPTPARGTIDLALERDASDRRRVVVCDRGGQPSITRYRRLAMSSDGRLASVLCRLITGRTHQIRVHLAAKGWPIVGDRVYGTSDRRIGRQALHAWQLTFTHPRTRERVTVVAPIAHDITALLETGEASDDGAKR